MVSEHDVRSPEPREHGAEALLASPPRQQVAGDADQVRVPLNDPVDGPIDGADAP